MIRIRAVPLQPHCFFFGGFDIQMHRTLEVMRSHGIDARALDFWSRDDEFDVVHFWGLESIHYRDVISAKRYGKKVVISALIPYLSVRARLRHIGGMIQGRRRILMNMLKHTDCLFVHNELQVDTAVRLFGMKPEKVKIIPAILDPKLYDQTAVPPLDDLRNYVACIGNIWPRKNQLRLAQAARLLKCPMIFCGSSMGGEDAYTDAFEKLIEETPYFRWYRWVNEENLRRVIFNSLGVALPSFEETQPMAALEGVAMSKPILLGNRAYATQKYFKGAYLADPSSVSSIADGLESILLKPSHYVPPRDFIMDCHPDSIGRRLKAIFDAMS